MVDFLYKLRSAALVFTPFQTTQVRFEQGLWFLGLTLKPLLCRAGHSYSGNFRRRKQMIKGLFRRSKSSSGIRIALLTNFAFLN